jgi:hypothetical protein
VRLEKSGQLINTNDLIGNRTRDLPACSVVPQSTTLPGSQRDTWTRESGDKKSPERGIRILSTKAKSNEMKSKAWEGKVKEWKRVERRFRSIV